MAGPVRLCDAGEVPPGGARRVDLPGRPPVAVFRLGESFYVTDDTCTHATASLCAGEVEGDIVVCPVHFGEFHIPTGRARCFPATVDLRTYRVELRDGAVFADLDRPLDHSAVESSDGVNR